MQVTTTLELLTPLAFNIPVLRRGAASIPSVVMAWAAFSSRPAANTAHLIAMVFNWLARTEYRNGSPNRRKGVFI